MATYNNIKRPTLAKPLQLGDTVNFTFKGTEYSYAVHTNHLNYKDGTNSTILRKVFDSGYTSKCSKAYGYAPEGGDWPCYRNGDYTAATRLVLAIFDEIDRIEGRKTRKDLEFTSKIKHDEPLVQTILRSTARMAHNIHLAKPEPIAVLKADPEAKKMAEIIHKSSFGCQKRHVAELMDVATGKPVTVEYDKLQKGESKPKDYNIESCDRVSMAMFTTTRAIGKVKSGTVFIVGPDRQAWSVGKVGLTKLPEAVFRAESITPLEPAKVVVASKTLVNICGKDDNYKMAFADAYAREHDACEILGLGKKK